jgi:hypothetical protein
VWSTIGSASCGIRCPLGEGPVQVKVLQVAWLLAALLAQPWPLDHHLHLQNPPNILVQLSIMRSSCRLEPTQVPPFPSVRHSTCQAYV